MTTASDFRTALIAKGFVPAGHRFLGTNNPHDEDSYTKEGFEGKIEIVSHSSQPDRATWAHRTAASGSGTGVRPFGGRSIKKMIKYLKDCS